MTITIKENDFTLHACGAVYWEQKDILLISDVHLGKIAHFRKHGVALPPDSAMKNYRQMTGAIEYFNAGKVIFLGDLFHSVKNREWEQFDAWVGTVSSRLLLVAGNHDVISQKHYTALGIDVVSEATIDNFLLTHHPDEREGLFNFCGHIHPSVRLRGFARQSLKLPCFFHSANQMILPAFGHFTGTHEMVPKEGDCVYAIANDKVVVVCE